MMKKDADNIHLMLSKKLKKPISKPKLKMCKTSVFRGYYDSDTETIWISKEISRCQQRSTYIHEWRHHWQYCRNKWKKIWNHDFEPNSYDFSSGNKQHGREMVSYFIQQPWELDALLFTWKWSYDEDDKWTMQKIISSRRTPERIKQKCRMALCRTPKL